MRVPRLGLAGGEDEAGMCILGEVVEMSCPVEIIDEEQKIGDWTS